MNSTGDRRPGRLRELQREFGVSLSTLWRYRKDGVVPPPRKTKSGSPIWDLGEIERERLQLLSAAEIEEILRRSHVTFLRWKKRKDFPKPVKRSGTFQLWNALEIERWAAARFHPYTRTPLGSYRPPDDRLAREWRKQFARYLSDIE
jgi:predicted DNA-binding transcriptional regulator AlpA